MENVARYVQANDNNMRELGTQLQKTIEKVVNDFAKKHNVSPMHTSLDIYNTDVGITTGLIFENEIKSPKEAWDFIHDLEMTSKPLTLADVNTAISLRVTPVVVKKLIKNLHVYDESILGEHLLSNFVKSIGGMDGYFVLKTKRGEQYLIKSYSNYPKYITKIIK